MPQKIKNPMHLLIGLITRRAHTMLDCSPNIDSLILTVCNLFTFVCFDYPQIINICAMEGPIQSRIWYIWSLLGAPGLWHCWNDGHDHRCHKYDVKSPSSVSSEFLWWWVIFFETGQLCLECNKLHIQRQQCLIWRCHFFMGECSKILIETLSTNIATWW